LGKNFPKDFPVKFSPLLFIIAAGIAGFILPAIGCAVYNLVAGWVGGIELRIEGERISRFSIAQMAKVSGVMYALIGAIFAIVLVLGFRFASFPQKGTFSGPGVGFALTAPIMYGVFGFIVAAIGCALYNLAAKVVGGAELQLEHEPTGQRIRNVSIFQTAKVLAVLYGMVGLLFLPIVLVIANVASKQAGFAGGFALLFPILFAAFGFILVAITCVVYNVLARLVGGIEIQLEGEATLA